MPPYYIKNILCQISPFYAVENADKKTDLNDEVLGSMARGWSGAEGRPLENTEPANVVCNRERCGGQHKDHQKPLQFVYDGRRQNT